MFPVRVTTLAKIGKKVVNAESVIDKKLIVAKSKNLAVEEISYRFLNSPTFGFTTRIIRRAN